MLERNPLQWIGYFVILIGISIPFTATYFSVSINNFQFCGIPIISIVIGTLFMAAGGRFR